MNAEEFAHRHEIAKLIGAPPGYVGHDIEPLLSQRRLDQHHKLAALRGLGMAGAEGGIMAKVFPVSEGRPLSIILFDEIEKAHPVLWNAMLGILEGGLLTLGDNSTTDFTRSIILMTSNIGSRQMSELMQRRPLGFQPETQSAAPQPPDFRETALAAARERFPLEFLNRFDEILVYSSLERPHLERIYDKFLADIHTRAIELAGVPLLIRTSEEAKSLIIERGTDPLLGARPLRRAIEVALVDPLSRLIASNRLNPGDVVEVEQEGGELMFYRRRSNDATLVV